MTDITEQKPINITERHRKWLLQWIAEIQDGGNQMTAYLKAFNVTNLATARRMASKYKTDLEKVGMMDQVFEVIGLDDVRLALKLKEGMDATKSIGTVTHDLVNAIKNATGKAETLAMLREVIEEILLIPDYTVRHKYLETALQLKGRLKRGTGVTITPGDKNDPGFRVVIEEINPPLNEGADEPDSGAGPDTDAK